MGSRRLLTMPQARTRKPSLMDVLVSLMVDPRGVTRQLFAYDRSPPWTLTTLSLFMCTCVVAPLMYTPSKEIPAPLANHLGPAITAALLTILCTSFFLLMALRSLNVRGITYRTFSSVVYATAPFITILSALLILNKVLYGDLSLLGSLALGIAPQGNSVLAIFPAAMRIAALFSLAILGQCLRVITNSSFSVGILLALSSLPLLLGSFIVALTVTDFIFPQSSADTIRFFAGYLSKAPY